MKIYFSAVLLLLLSGILFAVALGQTPASTGTPLPRDDQELNKAHKANEEAQADYYREQSNKLRQPSPSPTPISGKSFGQSVLENPASVVGVIGTILGAMIVAFVGLTTLFFNNRNAIKAQRDIQFYEAMKRLGDKDSPTLRASAAGLLALMAQDEWWELSTSHKPKIKTLPPATGSNKTTTEQTPETEPQKGVQKNNKEPRQKWPIPKVLWSKSYFTPALGQLMTALLLEDNAVVIESIKDALQQLIPYDVSTITHSLHKANVNLQDELTSLLAEFFVISDARSRPDPHDSQDSADLWKQLESLTGYEVQALRELVADSKSFPSRFDNYFRIVNIQDIGHRKELLSANHRSLRVSSNRLHANIRLFCNALEILQPKGKTPVWPREVSFQRSFLAGGTIAPDTNLNSIDFDESNFSKIVLRGANLENTSFRWANLDLTMDRGTLRNSCLVGARLRGASLTRVDMTDAMIGTTKIDSRTSLTGSAWWKANFYTTNPDAEVDDVLEGLYRRYRHTFPTDLTELHPSVRIFFENRNANPEPRQDS